MNEMVTITREEYDRLREAAEDLSDLRTYDRAKAALEAGEEELIPAEYANRLIDGESPVRVYRQLRGMTQKELADWCGLQRPYITEIEAGRKIGTVETLKSIAQALGVTLDDLAK